MRIEGYPIPLQPTLPAPAHRTAQPPVATQPVDDGESLTPQEKLRRALEERQWLSEAVFSQASPEGELGKHIDLRV
jgi:hypothetical protein